MCCSGEGVEEKQKGCLDIDFEVDDTLKAQMNSFLLSTASQQEIQSLDNKIHETVETINQLKTNREFFLSFAKDPQQFINKWIISQTRDLRVIFFRTILIVDQFLIYLREQGFQLDCPPAGDFFSRCSHLWK